MRKSRLIVLIVCMVLSILPLSVFGEVNEVEGMNQQENNFEFSERLLEQNALKRDPQIVREVKEKRTSEAKHYIMDDGSMQAVISSSDVHYVTEDGQFEEISTNLIDEKDLDIVDVPFSSEVSFEAKGNLVRDIP